MNLYEKFENQIIKNINSVLLTLLWTSILGDTTFHVGLDTDYT